MAYIGLSYETAKWIAPASFLYDFACQTYGGLSSPNMKEIHDANLSFFSPNPLYVPSLACNHVENISLITSFPASLVLSSLLSKPSNVTGYTDSGS